MNMRTVYRSSNGDDWLLQIDDAGAGTVVHRANLSSGGTETRMPVDEFLARGGGSPEAQAVRAAMAEATPTPVAEESGETAGSEPTRET
ncbi:hypothetical protein GTW51_21070 [Aurantimonas aggregata]|uniref:Uncharacterized protein n=1 Tax=Aurantimonas aggregata TaxID=2047720 RepID=A0A6L9MMJ6_9HYPH|nr:hypothetical protein [Aurantimonas aggregata]NDV89164.1 hypothetical protein [Aurantimonas aggregata]